jgi:hypothetical protein
VGAAVAPGLRNLGAVKRVVVAAIVGGTLSEITGGKFANGAASWAISAAMMKRNQDYEETELQQTTNNEPRPDTVRDNVIRNPNVESRYDILTGELVLRVPYAAADGLAANQESNFVSQIETRLTATFTDAATGEVIQMRVDLYKSLDIKSSLHIVPCDPRLCRNGVAGGWLASRGRMSLSATAPNDTLLHEFLHYAGLGHQWNHTNSIMSYSQNRRLLFSDVRRLYNAYRDSY